MDYGKTAYLKVVDLERKIGSIKRANENYSNYLEFNKPNVDESVTLNSPIIIDFNEFAANQKSVCFQIKVSLSANAETSISSEIIVNNIIILEENKKLLQGDNEIILLKTFEPQGDSNLKTSLRFSTPSNSIITINSASLIVLGASGENMNEDIELRVLDLNDKALISYIDSGKLYYQQTTLSERTLKASEFTFYGLAISHCFCKSSFESSDINLYRVDSSNNLYLKKFNSMEQEKLLATNVKVVYACPCPSTIDDTNLVAYIKTDGQCYFRSLRGNVVVNEVKLNLPKGEYTDIRVMSEPSSEIVYILASNKNGSNYILSSIIEVSTGRIIEKLSAKYDVVLTKYIDLGFIKERCIENLNTKVSLALKSVFYYEETINKLAVENLKCDYKLKTETYKIVPPIVYGAEFIDANYMSSDDFVAYTDDCKDFKPATNNYSNGEFNDNGWLDRWPYNEIRPCIIKDGKVVGYLNKDDYTQFEDGTPSHNNDSSYGEVAVEFPKIYYKFGKNPETGNSIVHISNRFFSGYSKIAYIYRGIEYDKLYISAYNCGPTNYTKTGFHSISGYAPNRKVAQTATFYNVYKNNFKTDYDDVLSFSQVTIIQLLYLFLFKRTSNSYYMTNSNGNNYSYVNGVGDKLGMYYGSQKVNGSKLFGLENIVGYRNTPIGGFNINSDGKVILADVYDPNLDYSPDYQSNYYVFEGDYVRPSKQEYIARKLSGLNELGFMNQDAPGMLSIQKDVAFSDRSYVINNSICLVYGSGSTDPYYNGIFSFGSVLKNEKWTYTLRLVYYINNSGE